MNRERDGGEILFHLSLQKIGGDRDVRERATFYVGRTERVNATAVRNRRSMGLSKSIGLAQRQWGIKISKSVVLGSQ